MSGTESNRQFAWGVDRFDGCRCPAVEAGYNPSNVDESTSMAETFDRMVSSSNFDSVALVPEDVAEKCWRRAISYLEEQDDDGGAAVGREIAEELGWEVNDE